MGKKNRKKERKKETGYLWQVKKIETATASGSNKIEAPSRVVGCTKCMMMKHIQRVFFLLLHFLSRLSLFFLLLSNATRPQHFHSKALFVDLTCAMATTTTAPDIHNVIHVLQQDIENLNHDKMMVCLASLDNSFIKFKSSFKKKRMMKAID